MGLNDVLIENRMFKEEEIGIKDINQKEIREGDTIMVHHLNYMGTTRESIAQAYQAIVLYHPFTASFRYYNAFNEKDEGNPFNHRSSRYRILNR